MDTTTKFTGKANIYSKYRPGYPEEFIRYLVTYNRLTPDSIVADVGAGTGIFSRQLLEKELNVIAVEPNDDMRIIAEKELSGYPRFFPRKAAAESTGIPEKSVDLITAAQAFHWFDTAKFKLECHRILKPGSNVALVWNSRDVSSPLIMENAAICKEFCPQFQGFSGGIEETPEVYRKFFEDGKYEKQEFPHHLKQNLDAFVGRNLSASYAPKSNEPNYKKFIDAITNLFAKYSQEGEITVPNITRSYIGKV